MRILAPRTPGKPKRTPTPRREYPHLYQTCRDEDCERKLCQVYREGYEAGYEEGYAVGFGAGFASGQASCSCS